MTGRPLWQWSATEIAAATRSGAVSCREVAASAVERMRTVNPRLNAVTLDLGDTALAAADALDARRRRGDPPGPLFGVPITIKDNVEVRGQRTPNGVAGLAHIIARDDAPIVRHLLDAGAVIVGRTNTPEFSMRATTNNALYGLTLNPWDARISCGGSSGGAAAAVASGICAIGHGNDVAGSIRFPAMHCGVAGLKPTSPAHAPLMSIQGPLARCVADIGLGLAVMQPPDASRPIPRSEVAPGGHAIGLIAEIPGMPIAPSVSQALRDATAALEAAGYVVEPVDVPDIVNSGEMALRFLMTELEHLVVPIARRLGSEQINWYFDSWVNGMPPFRTREAFLEAVEARVEILARWERCWRRIPSSCCRSARIRCSKWTRTCGAPSTCATSCAATRRAPPSTCSACPRCSSRPASATGCPPASRSSPARIARICAWRRRPRSRRVSARSSISCGSGPERLLPDASRGRAGQAPRR